MAPRVPIGTKPRKAELDKLNQALRRLSTDLDAHQRSIDALAAAGLSFGSPVTIGTANSDGAATTVARADHVHAHGNQTSGALHAAATTSVAGFMSAADKTKLDGLGTSAGDTVLYSVDFSTLANNTLSNGTETIDGFGWTIANAAAATTFAVENGTGIHFDAAASSTAYTTSSRTATNMSILISTLIPTWDPQRDYVIEVYFSSLTLGTSNNRVLVCLENTDNTGAERLLGGGRQNVSGTQRFQNQNEATARTSTITTTNDCFALKVSAGQMAVCGGASSGGDFPSAYGHADALSSTNGASVSSTTSFLTIAFPTGEAGGAMDAVLRRLQIRRVN